MFQPIVESTRAYHFPFPLHALHSDGFLRFNMQNYRSADRQVGTWFLALAVLVFGMAVIGAVTRLTGSGLSMVEWHALSDLTPPLSPAAWQRAFDAYMASPQGRQVNAGMTLPEFRQIYFWEWLHRLWGRVILGPAMLLPLIWFILRRRIDRGIAVRLGIILLLGCGEPFLGWFMVRSGLVDRPSVSHYRLALHLAVALALYAALVWNGLAVSRPGWRSMPRSGLATLRRHCAVTLALSATTMVWGALVAGLHAGLIYNTFPLMGGEVLPGEAFFLHPAWLNFFENAATVQFTHRALALSTAVAVFTLWLRAAKSDVPPIVRRLTGYSLLAVAVQVSLGVATLINHVPVVLAAAHQAGAIIVLTTLILCLFAMSPVRADGRWSPTPAV